MCSRHRRLGEASPTNPIPRENTIVFEPPEAAEPPPNLISIEAANDMAANFYHMGYRRGLEEGRKQSGGSDV